MSPGRRHQAARVRPDVQPGERNAEVFVASPPKGRDMNAKARVAFILIVGVSIQGGCTLPYFRGPILNLLGPTTAVAVAEPNAAVNSGQSVLIDGTGSFVTLGSGTTRSALTAGLTFAWTVASTPAGAVAPTLTNANSSQATFTATTVGTYTVQLMVSDGTNTGTSLVTIEVL